MSIFSKINFKSTKSVAVLAVLALVSCSDQKSDEPKTSKAEYVLAFSWQPAFCEGASRKRECKTQTENRFDAKHFTLHGLWPQPGSNIYCDVDKREVQLDKKRRWRDLDVPRLPQAQWDQLRKVMPGTMSSLHKHEWVKHGTCYSDSIEKYYADSIWLMEQLNASNLQKLFSDNIGRELSGRQIRQALAESFGSSAGDQLRVSCKKDQNSNRNLIVELTLGLSGEINNKANLSELIANAPSTKSGCPEGIVDPVGLQ